jgi:pilus assembly protein TadC
MGLALVLALASSVVLTIALGRVEPGAVTHRRRRLGAELPQALRLMAACLEAGLPLRSAVGAVAGVVGGPVSEELQPVLAQIAIGVAERDAWAGFGDHPVLGSVAKDLSRAVEAGTGVQAILVQRAAELRAEHRSAVQERARAVGVRSVLPLSLCFLPAFMLLGVVPAVAGMIAPILAP